MLTSLFGNAKFLHYNELSDLAGGMPRSHIVGLMPYWLSGWLLVGEIPDDSRSTLEAV